MGMANVNMMQSQPQWASERTIRERVGASQGQGARAQMDLMSAHAQQQQHAAQQRHLQLQQQQQAQHAAQQRHLQQQVCSVCDRSVQILKVYKGL